ncbi:MAG: preprotein translocase subunit SecE [Alphaproteobacteria bacterium]|nr:preprotein translocase subunit SecE [Reyranella sp.]MBL6940465.1 preprotein translocase subunit SecE [Alphaproteobacteria bacterium]MBL7100315.1 preprotein translocase subunit SecE [Alphaproteobacteria bacterium]
MADTAKKTADTAGKDLPAPARRRGNPLTFFTEVRRETSKVTWPSWRETWLTSMMVFIMVGITMVFFFGVDALLAYGERLLIGAAG